MNLVEEVDLTGEHASGMSHTSKTVRDIAHSRDGSDHDELSDYLKVDNVRATQVFLRFRDT